MAGEALVVEINGFQQTVRHHAVVLIEGGATHDQKKDGSIFYCVYHHFCELVIVVYVLTIVVRQE